MAQHPCPPLRYKYPCLKFTYKEAMELLRVKVTRTTLTGLAPSPSSNPSSSPDPDPNPKPDPKPDLNPNLNPDLNPNP